jgi:hypothetical protein
LDRAASQSHRQPYLHTFEEHIAESLRGGNFRQPLLHAFDERIAKDPRGGGRPYRPQQLAPSAPLFFLSVDETLHIVGTGEAGAQTCKTRSTDGENTRRLAGTVFSRHVNTAAGSRTEGNGAGSADIQAQFHVCWVDYHNGGSIG